MSFLSLSQIENAVEQILPDFLNRSFPVRELVDHSVKLLQADAAGRERISREVDLVLGARDDMFLSHEGDTATPRAWFFRNTQFRVIPSRLEIERGILLAGARFAPFCEPERFSDEYQLTLSGINKPVSINMYSLRFCEIAPAFLLLGRSGLIDHLVAESDDNRKTLRSHSHVEHADMVVSAFDLGTFYRERHFKEGDSLLISVDDWKECRFSAEFQSGDTAPDRDHRELWLRRFENAMLSVCEAEGDAIDLPDQIAHAYLTAFENGEDLRRTPDVSLDEYPSIMREIAIRKDGPDWIFVPADELEEPGSPFPAPVPPEHDEHVHSHEHDAHCSCGHDHPSEEVKDIQANDFSVSSGTVESLEAILAERGAPLDPIELRAYAVDSIANGDERFEPFRERMQSVLGIEFADDAQKTAFLNELEELWEVAREFFNPDFDGPKAPLRERLLELSAQRIDFSRNLLARSQQPDDIPHELVHTLKNLHRDIVETLSLLSTDAPLPDENDEAGQLELRVGDLEDAWDDLLERADNATF